MKATGAGGGKSGTVNENVEQRVVRHKRDKLVKVRGTCNDCESTTCVTNGDKQEAPPRACSFGRKRARRWGDSISCQR